MELVKEIYGKTDYNCPNCGADYSNCFCEEDVEDGTIYVRYSCPCCKLQIEEVFNYSHVCVWKADE